MPSGFASLDTSFPNLEGKTTEQKLQTMTDYLYQLLEQLRYTLHNLGVENFNETSLNEITEPIYKDIRDTSEGLETQITINAQGISTEVERATEAEGILSSRITQTATDIMLQVVGGYANEWASGRNYYENDVAKITAYDTGGAVTSVSFYRAKQDHTSAVGNKPPNATYWENIAAPNVQSIIDLNLGGITLSYDSGQVGADKNTAYVKLSKDGVQIAGNKIVMSNIEADTVKANALNGYSVYGANYYDEDGYTLLDLIAWSGGSTTAMQLKNIATGKTIAMLGHDTYYPGTPYAEIVPFLSLLNVRALEVDEHHDPNQVVAPNGMKFDGSIILKENVGYGSTFPSNPKTGQLFFKI